MAKMSVILLAMALFAFTASSQKTKPAPVEPRIVSGYDIKGWDIPNKTAKLPYTKVCISVNGYKGKYGFDAYAQRCRETPGCRATTAPQDADGCAYLKRNGSRAVMTPDAKWVVQTFALPPQKPCISFVNNGDKCTSDNPWVDAPVCCGGNRIPCVKGVCTNSSPGK